MAADPDAQRAAMAERWARGAEGWARRADRVREHGMPLSVWMVDHLELQPGQRVLELAAGPGDTGFLAAELIAPGGTLISSDAFEPMLDIARRRARELGIENVEFKQLQLEWIDLPTASVDAVLCRWGVMLIVDPDAALREIRRVLRPGGRAAIAVWDSAESNPWATITDEALSDVGQAEPPRDPDAPGMFRLSAEGRLESMLEDAGFVEVQVEPVELPRSYSGLGDYIEEERTLSVAWAEAFARLSTQEREELERAIERRVAPYTRPDGSFTLPGRSLAAVAGA